MQSRSRREALTHSMQSPCARGIHWRKGISNNEEPKGKTFVELAREHGEEAAINAGIVANSDTVELDSETIGKVPSIGAAAPHLIERYQSTKTVAVK